MHRLIFLESAQLRNTHCFTSVLHQIPASLCSKCRCWELQKLELATEQNCNQAAEEFQQNPEQRALHKSVMDTKKKKKEACTVRLAFTSILTGKAFFGRSQV